MEAGRRGTAERRQMKANRKRDKATYRRRRRSERADRVAELLRNHDDDESRCRVGEARRM